MYTESGAWADKFIPEATRSRRNRYFIRNSEYNDSSNPEKLFWQLSEVYF